MGEPTRPKTGTKLQKPKIGTSKYAMRMKNKRCNQSTAKKHQRSLCTENGKNSFADGNDQPMMHHITFSG